MDFHAKFGGETDIWDEEVELIGRKIRVTVLIVLSINQNLSGDTEATGAR